MYHQVLTLQNSTSRPGSELTGFMCISEQTANVSLYNINLQVFKTQSEPLYCAERT